MFADFACGNFTERAIGSMGWTLQSKTRFADGSSHPSRLHRCFVGLEYPGQKRYEYTAREHKVILSCMRAMLKKFSIDSDRFFITGHGAGADAAYDIAIAHPEHWAGVIGIAGKISKYPIQYMRNKHLGLNLYSVVGTKDIDNIDASADAWNEWLPSSSVHKCLVVEYIGRLASEPFFEEFPNIMNWCDVSRRSWPSMETCEIDCKSHSSLGQLFLVHGNPRHSRKICDASGNWPADGRGFNALKPKSA